MSINISPVNFSNYRIPAQVKLSNSVLNNNFSFTSQNISFSGNFLDCVIVTAALFGVGTTMYSYINNEQTLNSEKAHVQTLTEDQLSSAKKILNNEKNSAKKVKKVLPVLIKDGKVVTECVEKTVKK